MPARILAKNIKAGVYYALTDDGVELPVIDVTHPAFALAISESELNNLLQKHITEVRSRAKMPAVLQRLLFGILRKRSVLMRGIMDSAGGYLSGMNTYLMKLGPDNLDKTYAGSLDRNIAASLPVLTMRLRLQDVVRLLADGIVNALESHVGTKGTVHLLNIGGGPAIDSINALIVLQKERPNLLAGWPVNIYSLDVDAAGPSFGSRAVAALRAEGAPLHCLDVCFKYARYDWSDATALRQLLESFEQGHTVVATSSEGGLFEYGSDEQVISNLQELYYGTPAGSIVVGSVTRADDVGLILNASSDAALQLRGRSAFESLARGSGWMVDAAVDRPISHNIRLKKM